MSFLAPLFLAGAAAIALPIIFHLIRRTTKERTRFSSLMFLDPTPPRVTKRSQLENLWLLLLRCLVLLLLALGFSRPFLQQAGLDDGSGGGGSHVAILIDTSASMQRGDLWARARENVKSVLEELLPGDVAAVYTFDRGAKALVTFDQWSSLKIESRVDRVMEELGKVEPGWGATELGEALIQVVEVVDDVANRGEAEQVDHRRRIVVVSDLVEGSRLSGLQGYEWPGNLRVELRPLEQRNRTNAGIQPVAAGANVAMGGEATSRVRVSNVTGSGSEQFQVGWVRLGESAFAGPATEVYVPPGQSRVMKVPEKPEGMGEGYLLLTGDDEPFDNRAYVVTPAAETLNILYAGGEAGSNPREPLYYLHRALQQTRSEEIQVIPAGSVGSLASNVVAESPLLIVTDPTLAGVPGMARSFLERGRFVILMLRNAEAGGVLAGLAGVPVVDCVEAVVDDYAMLGQINFQHPILAPFSDPRFSDFTKIHFWKYRKLDTNQLPEARVLASFDGGDPAWLEIPVGKGTLIVFTSGWQPSDSQLALSSKFVPMLYSILDQTGELKGERSQYVVGDAVELSWGPGVEAGKVGKPGAEPVEWKVGDRFGETDIPGVYRVSSLTATQLFAVNLADDESNTAPLAMEELERLGLPLGLAAGESVAEAEAEAEAKAKDLQSTELENQQKLWRWLIVAALAFLLLETLVAGVLTRRSAAPVAT